MHTLKHIVTAPRADFESITQLFSNLNLILINQDKILSNEKFSHIYIPGMFVGGLYVGMHQLSLGDILKLWEKTEWKTESKYYFSIIGSPLSGKNTARWYNSDTKRFETGMFYNGKFGFMGLASPAFKCLQLNETQRTNKMVSQLSIFDLINQLSNQR